MKMLYLKSTSDKTIMINVKNILYIEDHGAFRSIFTKDGNDYSVKEDIYYIRNKLTILGVNIE